MDVSAELLAELSAPGAGSVRLRMSWEDYLELPPRPKAEWVDGEVVVSPPVGPDHGIAAVRLGAALTAALPRLLTMTEVGVRLRRNRVRVPDLMVIASRPEAMLVEEPPILVVEVLSPSTRSEDTVRKAPEYAAAGAGQFWVVDPDHRTIDVYANVDGDWEPLLHLDDDHRTGEVAVGDHGVVPLDLATILPL